MRIGKEWPTAWWGFGGISNHVFIAVGVPFAGSKKEHGPAEVKCVELTVPAEVAVKTDNPKIPG